MAVRHSADVERPENAVFYLPPGQWLLASFQDASTPSLLLHATKGQSWLAPSAGTAAPVDMAPAVKLLAFHDHVTGRPSRGGHFPDPVVVDVPAGFGSDLDTVKWLTAHLASGGTEVEWLCSALAWSEGYRLVRFLLAQDASANITELSARYGLSASHFRRLCRTVLGRTLKTELREWRAARSLMACSGRHTNFTHVAADFGYASPAHFSTDIRNIFGKSPTELLRPTLSGGYPR